MVPRLAHRVLDVFRDAIVDMPQPVGPNCMLVHPLCGRKAVIAQAAGAVSGTSNSGAEGDWITAERCLLVVDMTLAMGLPVRLASFPSVTKETELSEAKFCLPCSALYSSGTHDPIFSWRES